jgi:P4 family phage/plasmid primase-like protien
MKADRQAMRRYLERLHGQEPDGWLVIWTRQDKATGAFDLGKTGAIEEAVEYCASKATAFDVYAAVGLQQQQPQQRIRGTESGVVSLPGLWADVDIAGPAHKATNLPPTEADARILIASSSLKPSVIVRSGFGFQAYWLFKENYEINDEMDRTRIKSISTGFQAHLRRVANARGWALDPTADLCRVLRVPGTFNHKVAGDIRMVAAEYTTIAYNLCDFDELLAGVDDPGEGSHDTPPSRDLSPAKAQHILDGCVWMRHCRDEAAILPEPEWYHMMTIVARCEDSGRWAHELSQAYPQYSRRETETKLKQASSDKVAPVTCAYVQSALNGGRFCTECSFRGIVNSPITIGRIEDFAIEPENGDATPSKEKPTPVATAVTTIERYTDLGNARRFVAKYRGLIRYCELWGKWLLWDGMRWAEDERLEVMAYAADLIRGLYALAKRFQDEADRKAFLTHVTNSESYRAINAMVTLGKADPAIASHPEDFDTDPWALAVRSGIIDLRTGKIRPHDPKDLVTKLAPVTFDAGAQCPDWLAFLDMIMLSRKGLVEFLKRALGSSLTGITSDKAMFILYGPGGDNGKSTMVEVIEMLLGDYARRTPVETFLKKREGSIPNDIARLRGARFVWAAESDRGVRLAESLIKELTGGDRITARFLNQEFFEFMPAFKIWLATNHKPTIRGDAAIWRRLKLIPFNYTIPKEKQKKRNEVMVMFKEELPGILNWALEGCLEWQRDGLGVPDEVVNATAEYEAEQDTFSMFLEEECVRVPNATSLSLMLYQRYKPWAEQRGEKPASHKTFASLMSERSFPKTKTQKGVLYSGIGLRIEEHHDARPEVQTPPRPAQGDDGQGEEV